MKSKINISGIFENNITVLILFSIFGIYKIYELISTDFDVNNWLLLDYLEEEFAIYSEFSGKSLIGLIIAGGHGGLIVNGFLSIINLLGKFSDFLKRDR